MSDNDESWRGWRESDRKRRDPRQPDPRPNMDSRLPGDDVIRSYRDQINLFKLSENSYRREYPANNIRTALQELLCPEGAGINPADIICSSTFYLKNETVDHRGIKNLSELMEAYKPFEEKNLPGQSMSRATVVISLTPEQYQKLIAHYTNLIRNFPNRSDGGRTP